MVKSLIGTAVRRLRAALNLSLAVVGGLMLSQAASGAVLARHQVRSILVCRPNVKLGNTLLLSPLLTELNRQYPDADIDVVSAYARAPQLFQGQPGLRRVLFLNHKAIASPVAFIRQLAEIRRQRYDLAIDPNPSSLTGRFTVWASRSEHRLGFSGRNQWLSLTHAFPAPEQTMHESERPLLLLKSIVPESSVVRMPLLEVHLDATELEQGRRAVTSALASRNAGNELVIGHLTGAAGAKALGAEWWNAFWRHFRALEPGATPVEFLGWQGKSLDESHVSLSLNCPRQMAAAISAVNLFICADTGPMHLASATPTPTIGLFVTTDPVRYRPRKDTDLAPVVASQDPAQVATICVEHLRRCLRRNIES